MLNSYFLKLDETNLRAVDVASGWSLALNKLNAAINIKMPRTSPLSDVLYLFSELAIIDKRESLVASELLLDFSSSFSSCSTNVENFFISFALFSFIYYCGTAGCSAGFGGGVMVFKSFGGTINSSGNSIFSSFGNKRVSGFPQPVSNKLIQMIRRYFITPPSSSMAF